MSNLVNFNRAKSFTKLLNLYKPTHIVHNFRSMYTIFPYNTILKGDYTYQFNRDINDLPETFPFKDEMVDIKSFLEKYWTTGLIVIKDNQILYENYWLENTKNSLCISWSMGKSILSALVGIAIDEGYIDNINVIVSDIAPELKCGGYNGVTLKQVLQMTSGVHFNEDYKKFSSDINKMARVIALGGSLNKFASKLKSEKEPGTYNHYVSMDTQVLGMVLSAATNRPLSNYLEEKLWQPLGMESDGRWLLDYKGMELAFGGICATLRDFARFGQLFVNQGLWENKQIIPKQWIHDSVTPDVPFLEPGDHPQSASVLGYGYQWWIPEEPDDDYMGIGINGQYIYINPNRKIVIVKTAANPDWYVGCPSDPMFQSMCQYLAKEI